MKYRRFQLFSGGSIMKIDDYLQKVYSGFIGMNVGIRLGAPVEPTTWTSDRIQRFYGDITGYIKDFKNFAADDDANGPVFFLRALDDGALERPLTPKDVSETWLNYSREGVGMFWWGGYGVSTEHTAYLNLLNGIEAPRSGSKKTNGITLAEQIGGQIFIDTWGLIHPGDPVAAARDAVIAASVAHDGEGLHGAAFIAACISKAFETSDVDAMLDCALSLIPCDSTYAKVVIAVRNFHTANPNDWRKCLCYLQENWGYDRYPGVCHIIPNAGVCIMALLYGREFCRAIEIATMAGWDTDCNAGNVGTIMGVAGGIDCIPDYYRNPINDSIVLSGISGYLNILDIPSYAKHLATIGFHMRGEKIPPGLRLMDGTLDFDFSLNGSTHNLRIHGTNLCRMSHRDGAVEVLFDRMARGQKCHIYYKPFYRREDFNDERYMPVFSPTAYPGQQVTIHVCFERFGGETILLSPYVRETTTKRIIELGGEVLKAEGERTISFEIPNCDGAMVDEIGLVFESNSPPKFSDFGVLRINKFTVSGKADYTIAMNKQSKEFASITPFSHNHGAWELVSEKNEVRMQAMCLQHAEACTGNYFMRDVRLVGTVCPYTGDSHLIGARIQGARRGYYAGFAGGTVVIFCHKEGTLEVLASAPFRWSYDNSYRFEFLVKGDRLFLSVDGVDMLEAKDTRYAYGMAGYAMYAIGRCGFGDLTITEI
jgi:ADP-ribosylglycohydrolase